jgi:hypothetical protein
MVLKRLLFWRASFFRIGGENNVFDVAVNRVAEFQCRQQNMAA